MFGQRALAMNPEDPDPLPGTPSRLMVDVNGVIARHGLPATWQWTHEQGLGLSLRVALRALAEAGGDPDDELVHILERITIHLASEAWTTPMWWATLEDGGNPEAREAYGASLGVQHFAMELLNDYSSPAVVERVESLLQTFAAACAKADSLPEDHDAIEAMLA